MVADNRDPLRTAYTVTHRRGARRDDGHQCRRPGAHDPAAGRPVLDDGLVRASRPRDPVAGQAPAVCSSAPATPRPPSTCAGSRASRPAGAIGELVNDDGTMMRLPEVLATGAVNDVPVITIEQLIAWRQLHDRVETPRRDDPAHQARRVLGDRLPRPADR